jgi:hypothetical protein
MILQQTPVTTADTHPCFPANWNPWVGPLSAGSEAVSGELQPSDLVFCCLSRVCLVIANRLQMQYTDSAQGATSGSTDES